MRTMRLTPETLSHLPPDIARPAYDRTRLQSGIVHLGIGAFHRAHQAVYTDAVLSADDPRWGITAVSLRSPQVRDQLEPQSGLYSLTERSGSSHNTRVIGAVQRVLVAPENPAAVVAAMAAQETQIISFTITEKGYLRDFQGRLDRSSLALIDDLAGQTAPQSIYGLLHAALSQRRAAGLPGLTLLCCDNLTSNGEQLARLVNEFLDERDPEVGRWFRAECTCPSTMVDRIVPATTPADLEQIAARLGVEDAGAVITEPFTQWVIEDRFAGPRPRWELLGNGSLEWVRSVRTHEIAKLRMLNGAHSALAYLGLAQDYQFVHQAMADPALLKLVSRLMREEAATSLANVYGDKLDLDGYADMLIARFTNSALPHRLIQIAMDGSQKIPQRWLETLRFHQHSGQDCPSLLQALAAWIRFVRADRYFVDDPLAAELERLWLLHGHSGIVNALFGPQGLFAHHWTATPQQSAMLTRLLVDGRSVLL